MGSLTNSPKILFRAEEILTHEVSKATPRQPYTLSTRRPACSLLIGKSGMLHIGESYNQLKYVLAPEVVVLVPAQARRNYSLATPHGKVSFYEIVLGEGVATSYFKFLHQDFGLRFQLSTDGSGRRLLGDLETWDQLNAVEQSKRIFELLLQLHQEGKRQRNHLQQILSGNHELLKVAAQEHRFSVQSMALALGCSTAYLDKRFQELYGRSCGTLLRMQRLELACELLRAGKLTLAEIAYECAYANATSLSTALKQATGKSLKALRSSKSYRLGSPILLSGEIRARMPKSRKPSPTLAPVEPYFHFVGGCYKDGYPYSHNLSISNYPLIHNWVLTLEGKAKLIVDGHEYELSPGTVSIQPTPMRAVVRTIPGVSWKRISIRTFGPLSYNAFEMLTGAQRFLLEIDLDSRPVHLAKKWVSSWNKNRNQPSEQGSRQAYEWLLSWYELIRDSAYRQLPSVNLYDYICPTIHKDVSTVTEYAAEHGYSRGYFTRKLMETWVNTPAKIMREQRLAQAAQKLQYSRMSIDDIASGANYSHTSSFIKAFKAVYGMTPLQYRYS